MKKPLDEAKKYKELNQYAEKSQVVVFGDNYLFGFPYYDLMQGRVTDYAVYNRSIPNMTLEEAVPAAEYCLYHLSPKAVLLCFEKEGNEENFRENYLQLIKIIRSFDKKCSIGIIDRGEKSDETLENIAKVSRCDHLHIPAEWDYQKAFHTMDAFFRGGKISFWDAFSL